MLEKAVNGAAAIIIIVVGASILLRWGKKGVGFRSLGGALILFGAFVFLYSYVEISGVFTAWATLALALATFLMVEESSRSRDQTRQINEQRRDEEKQTRDEDRKREFRRHCLDQIVDWVQDVRQEIFRWRQTTMFMYELSLSLSGTTGRIAWVSRISKIFGGELETTVKTASDTLLEFMNPSSNKQLDLQTLEKTFVAVLDAVYRIKTEEIL